MYIYIKKKGDWKELQKKIARGGDDRQTTDGHRHLQTESDQGPIQWQFLTNLEPKLHFM